MRIAAIHPRGEGLSPADAAYLEPGNGLRGNPPPKKAGRELSLLAAEIWPGLRECGGLCTGRFDADILTEGVEYAALATGDRLRLGRATLEMVVVGKRCFDECPLRQRGERCPLPQNCAFARVVIGGAIAVGDEIVREVAHG